MQLSTRQFISLDHLDISFTQQCVARNDHQRRMMPCRSMYVLHDFEFGFHISSEFGVVPTHAICAVEHRQYIALDCLDIHFSSGFMG